VQIFSQIIVLILIPLFSFAGGPVSSVKSFKDWKAEKIQQIQAKLSQTKANLEDIKARKAQDPLLAKAKGYESLIQKLEKDQSQNQWNLDVASDLSLTDYMALYLSHQSSKTRFLDAAAQLQPADVAELLEAYNEALDAGNSAPALTSSIAPSGKSVGPSSANLSQSNK
jgi:hypothetical protein